MKKIAFLFALFIIAIIILADNGKLGWLYFIYDFPNGDKVGHFILFGLLTLFIDLYLFQSLPGRDPGRVAVVTGLILALLISAEEFSQKFFPLRTFSWLDLLASYLGVLIFSLLSLKIKKAARINER